MVFGFGDNTAPITTSGFRSGQANQGWNLFSGAKNSVVNFVNQEIPYTRIFAGFVSAGQRISTFDFNKTDVQLENELKQHNTILASSLGALTGRSIGKALSIGGAGLAGITVPKISSTNLAKRLVQATSEEAKEEILDEVTQVLRTVGSLVGNRLLIEGYMKFRSFLKKQPLFVLERFFDPATARYIKNTWGEPDAEPLILSETIEEKVESISNPMIQNFVEEALEEFYDAFIESGFIIATELDSALAEFQMQSSQPGQTITVQTVADEPNSEQIIITGDNPDRIQENAQEAIQNWRMLQNRDIGNIVARDVEIVRSNPQSRRLEITFKSKAFPPFVNADGSPSQEAILTIPNVKKNISWDKLKRILKYNKSIPAFIWGESTARLWFMDQRKLRLKFDANLNDIPKIEAYLKDISDLSESIFKGVSTSNILDQPTALKDEPIGMYPVEAKLITRNLALLNRGNANQVPHQEYRFLLWTDNEPGNFTVKFNQSDL